MRILTTFAVAAAALWLYSPQAFADSTNGNGGGQGNGQGCGAGNTSAQNGGTCPGGSGGAGAQGGAGCVGGSDTVGCVIINANVAANCQLGINSATITIAELSDTSGNLAPGSVNGQTAQLNGWCNGTTSTIAVEAFPLLNAGTAPGGFTNRIDYTATATAHPASGDVAAVDTTTAGGAGTAPTVGVFSSNIDVALSLASSATARLLAGSYQGSVVVTLTPGL